MVLLRWRHLLMAGVAMLAAGGQADAAQTPPAGRLYERSHGDTAAFTATTRSAEAGDTAAMLRLGQILWYGAGVPTDRAKADALFKRAALAGNLDAAAYLELSAERERRSGEIRRWTSQIDAGQLTGTEFDCTAPTFPPYSSNRTDAREVAKGLEVYRQCYNDYVDTLFGDVAEERRIPSQVARVMSDDEFEQSKLRIHTIVEAETVQLKVRVAPVLAERDRWIDQSRRYIRIDEARWRLELALLRN